MANGDVRDNWIAGYENPEGKWIFILPLKEGKTYIPLVSISNTYLTSYEAGKNPLERAFYPRQITVDLTMDNDSLSALFIGEKEDAAKDGAETIALDENKVFKDILEERIMTPGNTDSTVTILEEPVILSFFSASKQIWYERKATISKKVKTIGASAFFGCKKATKLIIKGTAIKKFGKKSFAKTGIKKLVVSNKKKKAAYKKKLIKAGMSKKVK